MTTTEPLRARAAVAHLRSVRVRILVWVLALVALALGVAGTAFYLVERARVDQRISDALGREVAEFEAFAGAGTDPVTGTAFESSRRLLQNALARNVPDEHQVLVGFVEGKPTFVQGTRGTQLVRSGEFVSAVNARADGGAGEVQVDGDTVRFAAKAVRSGSGEGTFVVAAFADAERAELRESLRTYVLVAVVALLMVAAGAWAVAGRLLRPLRELRVTAGQISHSDLTRRIPVTGKDDISELARTFNEMLDRLEKAFATQRRFLDEAGHELRTPITILRGHLELMSAADPADVASTQDLLLDELDRMGRLVDDLMMLARSERPDFLRPREVELGAFLDDVLVKARGLADRSWRCDERAEARICADPHRLTQAMLALASNAVRHTGPDGIVALGSRCRDGQVQLWVRDSGPGVAAADAARIFQRFERGANPSPDGAGLGLAIVRAIATAHGGTVRVESTPGSGARFLLDLPAEPSREAQVKSTEQLQARGTSS